MLRNLFVNCWSYYRHSKIVLVVHCHPSPTGPPALPNSLPRGGLWELKRPAASKFFSFIHSTAQYFFHLLVVNKLILSLFWMNWPKCLLSESFCKVYVQLGFVWKFRLLCAFVNLQDSRINNSTMAVCLCFIYVSIHLFALFYSSTLRVTFFVEFRFI